MRAISKFIRNRKDVATALHECECPQHLNVPKCKQWQNMMNGRVEDLIESTCCHKIAQPLLEYGVGSTKQTPSLLQ